MFTIALLLGLYAYCIFFLGLAGFLYLPLVVLFTLLYAGSGVFYYRKQFLKFKLSSLNIKHYLFHTKLFSIFLWIVIIQALINLIGALGPELGFDALWYHLTFPKLYLTYHAIIHIPGGLLYYSDMPKLIELLYTGLLSFHLDFLPKLLHFGFGIATLFVLYKLSRKWLSPLLSIAVCTLFYSNLVVGWESISAYIDLGRTFFEVLSVYAFFEWMEKKESRWFYYAAIMVGFAVATKVIAFSSFFIFLLLIFLTGKKQKEKLQKIFKWIVSFSIVALSIPLPWFVFSLIHTGNPFYPLFDPILGNAGSAGWQLLNPLYFIITFWTLFTNAADPISPWYFMLLPLITATYKFFPKQIKLLSIYALLSLFCWYLTPNTGGGRFILPYLPILSIVSIYPLTLLTKQKKKLFLVLLILLSIISIGYRGLANAKFLPVLLGKEATTQFLTKNLNFSYGDFVDSDGYFKRHIKSSDTVLLYGFHNLYYVDFPFVDSSYVAKGDTFNYIATQNTGLPKRFSNWTLIYTNPITHVSLYSAGGIPWIY